MELLGLKEAMSNAPHVQQLALQFSSDADEINHLLREFNTSCSFVVQAQETLASSYLQMSEIARLIGSKNLAVQPKNADFENICLQFSSLLEEISGMHRSEAEELRSALFLPAHKLPSQPGLRLVDNSTSESAGDEEGAASSSLLFADLPATQRHREACEREVHAALARYMRLTRRCAPKEHDDAVVELSRRRRMFQKASVIYYSRLNAAHFEREMVPLNAFFGLLSTLRSHLKKRSDVLQQDSLGQFAEVIKTNLDCRLVQSTQATEEFLNTITGIQGQSLAVFAPEPLFAKSDKSYLRTPTTNLLSKSGYLYMRVKKTFGFDWIEVYCFTQGGNLLYQQKGDLGAGVLVNLNGKGVFAEPVDIDDRRYTFQIVCAAEKREKKPPSETTSFLTNLFSSDFHQNQTHTVVLQAENSTDRDEWIATISNVIVNTSNWAGKGGPPPEPKSVDPLPFVLVPRSQYPPEVVPSSGGDGAVELSDSEVDTELERALRASLASPAAWISQSPPLHLELIPTATTEGEEAVPQPPPVTGKDDGGLETVEVKFVGCMPMPRYLVNRSAVHSLVSHIVAKRQSTLEKAEEASGQVCEARFAPDSLFILLPLSTPSTAVLSHFRLSQIVQCADVRVDNRELLLLLTAEPHSAQWSDLTSGSLLLCHVFDVPNPREFAERVLNLQLMRLATLNEGGESPEKAQIMENVVRSSEWNSAASADVNRPQGQEVTEQSQQPPQSPPPPPLPQTEIAPTEGDDHNPAPSAAPGVPDPSNEPQSQNDHPTAEGDDLLSS